MKLTSKQSLTEDRFISHFYTEEGEARHEVQTASKTAKKPMRPSTIADARKNGWLPSATTILDIIGAEGLVTWKMDQICRFAREVDDQVSHAGALLHAKQQMGKHLDAAAEGGNILHNDLEVYAPYWMKGQRDTRRGHWNKLLDDAGVVEILYSERMMASRELGYAGTGDLLGVNKLGQLVVFDLKTKDTKGKVERNKTYKNEKYELQLGCYANLARKDSCPKIQAAVKKGIVSVIAYVSRDEEIQEEGQEPRRWTKVDKFDEIQTLDAGIAYQALFEVWTWSKNYDPRMEF